MRLIDGLDCQSAFQGAVERAYTCSSAPSKRGNYNAHYKPILNWFKTAASEGWTSDQVIQGSLMVYGWMPTVLEGRKRTKEIDPEKPALFAKQLGKYRENPASLTTDAWNSINGSYTGTSNFLHFWSPANFAIWDINVARALVSDEGVAKKLRYDQIERLDHLKCYQALIRCYANGVSQTKIRDVEEQLFRFGKTRAMSKGSA